MLATFVTLAIRCSRQLSIPVDDIYRVLEGL
jgi:hypothetical protein